MNKYLSILLLLVAALTSACATSQAMPTVTVAELPQVPTLLQTPAAVSVPGAFDSARALEYNRKLSVDIGKRVAGTPGGNSGVLVHANEPGALNIWPRSLEAQLNHLNAGDIWVIPADTKITIENADKRVQGRRHFNLTDDSEKPIGEWNDYEITCNGDELTIKVNGVLVNHATKCSLTKGAICLQSEGAEIHFRDIRLTPLKK